MQKQITTILSILVLAIVFSAIGFGVCYFYQKNIFSQTCSGQIQKDDTVEKLSSPLVNSIIVSGTVTNISDREITLNSGDNYINVTMDENATMFLVTKSYQQEKITLNDIKNGEIITIISKLSAEGILTGSVLNINSQN